MQHQCSSSSVKHTPSFQMQGMWLTANTAVFINVSWASCVKSHNTCSVLSSPLYRSPLQMCFASLALKVINRPAWEQNSAESSAEFHRKQTLYTYTVHMFVYGILLRKLSCFYLVCSFLTIKIAFNTTELFCALQKNKFLSCFPGKYIYFYSVFKSFR